MKLLGNREVFFKQKQSPSVSLVFYVPLSARLQYRYQLKGGGGREAEEDTEISQIQKLGQNDLISLTCMLQFCLKNSSWRKI